MGIFTRTGGTITFFGGCRLIRPSRQTEQDLIRTRASAAMGFSFSFAQAVTANVREVRVGASSPASVVYSTDKRLRIHRPTTRSTQLPAGAQRACWPVLGVRRPRDSIRFASPCAAN